METLITDSPAVAAEFVRRGRVAAFPTETVYGLGADALHDEAVREIFRIKGRPEDNPLIVHLASVDMIGSVVDHLSKAAERLIQAFFPGPLTVVTAKSTSVPKIVTAGLQTVGVRVPSHPVAHAFLTCSETPVAAPSANVSGRPSATRWQSVAEDFEGVIPCILKGGRSEVGLESTVVDCTGDTPVLLRSGAISLEQLQSVTEVSTLDGASEGLALRSPGLRHRHYAPRAKVVPVDSVDFEPPPGAAFIGLEPPHHMARFERIRLCASPDEYAHELFGFFRDCDVAGIRTIYCGRPPAKGIGTAILDRIERASRS